MRIDNEIENWIDYHSNITTLGVILLVCVTLMVVF